MTRVEDVIVPSVFMPYVIQRTAEKSRLFQSGIIQNTPKFDQLASGEGRLVDMPFWFDLDGDDEVIKGDGTELAVDDLATDKDVATKIIRGKAWGYDDLVQYFAGSDPSAVIGDLIADYRVRRLQAQLIATLKGIFSSASMSASTLDVFVVSGAVVPGVNTLNASTFIDAKQLLGDSKELLTAIVMHSKVEAYLAKLDLIDFIPGSDTSGMVKVFQGLEVIVDDGCPVETVDAKPVYTSYLFGKGALAMGNGKGNVPIDGGHGTWETEFGRASLKGESHVIFRWKNIMHLRGVRFTDNSVAAKTPSNTELGMSANWTRVYETKNIRCVRIRSNAP